MIDKAAAKRQVARLSQMYGYPRGDDQTPALNELIRATESAPDLGTAERAVSALLETATAETRCPMPGDLRKAIADAGRVQEGRQYWEAPQYETVPLTDEERAENERFIADWSAKHPTRPLREKRSDLRRINAYLGGGV